MRKEIAMKKRKNRRPYTVIGGYYGFGSIGDEAVLYSILSALEKNMPESTVCVLTNAPESLPTFNGITVTGAKRSSPLAVLKAFLKADLYISGGGSLLQDSTSHRSLCYYCALILLARLCGARVCILANGIGPLKDKKRCALALRLADTVSVRDPDSLELLRTLSPEKASVHLSADPIFAYPFSDEIKKRNGRYFAVSQRNCEGDEKIDEALLATVVLYYKNQGLEPVFVSMQDSYDLSISRRLCAMTGGTMAEIGSADELFALLSGAEFAIGMRLHFLLTAAMANIPTVALSYDCKVESCMKYLGYGEVINAFDFCARQAILAIEKAKKSCDREKIRSRVLSLKELFEKELERALSGFFEEELSGDEKFFADT